MDKKKVCKIISVIFLSVFFFAHTKVFSSDVYFNPQKIKEKIVGSINNSNETIDIAVVSITSTDILHALAKAYERGVEIRLVVDKERSLEDGVPLTGYFQKNRFPVRMFSLKGNMDNHFAIFDSGLLLTGSYRWNESVNKIDRNNVIVTKEAKVMVKYQREFDRLFYKGRIPGSDQDTVASVEKENSEKERKVPEKEAELEQEPEPELLSSDDNNRGQSKVLVSEYGVVITGPSDEFIDMSFRSFNSAVGLASGLTKAQRRRLWDRCVGKKVQWTGTVKYIGWTLLTGWMMNVSHGDTSVEVELNSDNKPYFSQVEAGNTVRYSGRLENMVSKVFPYKLIEGEVLEIVGTDTEPFLNEDQLSDVSQGPKKKYIVDTFDDLESIFGGESTLSNQQKKDAWNEKYKGKYVRWMGKIAYKNFASDPDLRIGIKQNNNVCVELKIDQRKKTKMSDFAEGDEVLCTGKLTNDWGTDFPYVLEDGDILTIK